MKTVRDICKYIGSVICDGPVCIETGSTFAITPENLIHTTTNNIAEHVCLYNYGILYSLDISAERQKIAESVLPVSTSDYQLDVHFICGDSVDIMKKLAKEWTGAGDGDGIDLLCLDSSGDPDHILNEYNAIKDSLAEKHFVLVDDIHNPSSIKYKKVVPLLKELGYNYIEVPTPVGMFMASKGYDLPQV